MSAADGRATVARMRADLASLPLQSSYEPLRDTIADLLARLARAIPTDTEEAAEYVWRAARGRV